MSKVEEKRPYRMSKRAESAARTEHAIFSAAAELWREHSFAEITLDQIAEKAGVSVRTVIRRYGSKEALYESGIQSESDNMEVKRDLAIVGEVDSALNFLLEDYEKFGDAVMRTLALEEQLSAAKKVSEAGRKFHRQWCARIFAPFLPIPEEQNYEQVLTAFVAASDIYLWKLLRRDLGYDLETTRQTFKRLLNGLT